MNGVTYPQTRYTYDPITQSYARTPMAGLSAVAPQQIYDSGGGDSGVGSPGSSGTTSSGTVGSSGTLGGVAQGVNAAVSNVQNAIGPLSMAVPGLGIAGALSNMGVNKSMDVNEEADAALAAANQQANQATVSMGAFGPQVTTAVDISPVANPAAQEVTAISPTMGLTAMNQAQKAEEQEATPAAVAATVADAVASFADTQDAEAGATAAANAAAAAGTTGGGGGGGGAPGAPGEAPSIGGTMDQSGSNDAPSNDGPSSSTSGTGTDTGASEGNWRMGGRVMNYEQGGLMGMGDAQPQYAYAPIMMSNGGLPAAARKVQAQGRNGDSTLVHMTQGEVKGLDAIARAYGGRITINPETGLPEANFLKSLLPVIAGAALNFAVPGLGAALGGFAIPALVGGASYLMNPQQGLMGGLMAGLGAYGGMGIGNALTAAGAATTAPAVTGTAPGLVQAGAVAPQAAATTVPGTATAGLKSALAPQAFTAAPAAAAPPSFMGNLAQAGRGVTALGTEAGRTAAMQSLGGPMGAVKTIGAVTAPMSMGGLETPEMGSAGGTPTRIRPFKYTRTARPDAFNPPSEPGAGSYERRYFDEAYTAQPTTEVLKYAMGGDIEEGVKNGSIRSFDDDYGQDEYAMGGLTAFNSGGLQDGGFVVPADVVAHLGNGSTTAGYKVLAKGLGARPIKGKGDGMSDSIPTTIDGKQPARVADGEAYVPAEKVKEVGPKRLYKMMEKVRQARTNSTRQAPAINPREYIPA